MGVLHATSTHALRPGAGTDGVAPRRGRRAGGAGRTAGGLTRHPRVRERRDPDRREGDGGLPTARVPATRRAGSRRGDARPTTGTGLVVAGQPQPLVPVDQGEEVAAPQSRGRARPAAAATLGVSFDGLDHFDQRTANGGNQFSRRAARPGPVRRQRLRAWRPSTTSSGSSTPPATRSTGVVDQNTFYGYAAAINRTTNKSGPVRDRSVVPLRPRRQPLVPRRADAGDEEGHGRLHREEPPRPRGERQPRPDGHVDHLPHPGARRRHPGHARPPLPAQEQRFRSRAVHRRLPAHRRRRQRLLPHDERVLVLPGQHLQRRPDLRVLQAGAGRHAEAARDAAVRHHGRRASTASRVHRVARHGAAGLLVARQRRDRVLPVLRRRRRGQRRRRWLDAATASWSGP